MLVLERKKDEKVTVETPCGVKVEVMCVRTGTGNVRIGIDAPKAWKITREELMAEGKAMEGNGRLKMLPFDEEEYVRSEVELQD